MLDWIGTELRWTSNSAWPRSTPFRPADLDYVSSYAADLETEYETGDPGALFGARLEGLARTDYGLFTRGGANFRASSPFSFRFYSELPEVHAGQPLAPIAILRVTVPTTWPIEDFRAHALAMAKTLRTRWWTAGYMYAGNNNAFHVEYWKAVHGHARRYLGFDEGEYVNHMRSFYKQIRSVNWITSLSDDLARKLKQKPHSAAIRILESGKRLTLQIGAHPARGDRNRLGGIDGYAEVDRFVRGVRATDGLRFNDPFDERTTTEWLRRFELLYH